MVHADHRRTGAAVGRRHSTCGSTSRSSRRSHDGPITGRVFVMMTRIDRQGAEPRLQIGRTGVPFFGRDVERLAAGEDRAASTAAISARRSTASTTSRPATTSCRRSSSSTPSSTAPTATSLWMHDDQWEGQRWNRSPGNAVQRGRRRSTSIPAPAASSSSSPTQSVPPIAVPPDTKYVKRIKFQSPSLTKFWGRPIYLGAVVLLPARLRPRDDQLSGELRAGALLDRARRTASTRRTTSRRRG